MYIQPHKLMGMHTIHVVKCWRLHDHKFELFKVRYTVWMFAVFRLAEFCLLSSHLLFLLPFLPPSFLPTFSLSLPLSLSLKGTVCMEYFSCTKNIT